MRRIFFLSLVFLILFAVSCNSDKKSNNKLSENLSVKKTKSQDKPAYGDSIVTPLADDIYNLNFIDYKTASEEEIIYLIADSLCSYDNNLNIVPRLAESWEINENNTEVIFYLRKNVKFHDGVECTAEDVKYTYDAIFDPRNKLDDIAQLFKDLKETVVLDKYTVKFVFKKPQPFLLEFFVDSFILPKHIYANSKYGFKNNPANLKPIGTGPFILKKWVKNSEIVLEANPDYFLGRPYLDKVIYLKGGNLDVDFERLKKGEFDLVPISSSTWKFKGNLPEIKNNFVKFKYYLLGFFFIAWNVNKYPLNKRDVRLALAYLSDLERFNKLAFFGLYKVAISPIHPNSKYFNKSLRPFPFDVEKAKQLLLSAGFEDRDGDGYVEDEKGRKLEIDLIVSGDLLKKYTEYYQQNLKKAGIKLNIDFLERGIFQERMNKLEYDGVLYGWMIYPDPTYLFSMFRLPDRGDNSLNINRYKDPNIDFLLDKLENAYDESEQINICYRIQDIVYQNQPYLFLFYPSALVLTHKRYRNIKPSPLGMFKWYPGVAKIYVPEKLQKREKGKD